jgi:hypothetical protein
MEQPISSRVGKAWDVSEESTLLQSLSAGVMPEEIAGVLQRKVGGINSRRYIIAERIISQGGTVEQAAELVKYTAEQVRSHVNKMASLKLAVCQPVAVQTEPQGISMKLIHKVGAHIGLSMDHYIGKVHTWENTDFLTFRDRNDPRGKSLYTLNLKTLRPTQTSPIQKQLNAELELALA